MSAWPTAASRRLELFSAFSGNPDGFVCLVYIALHCSAICKRDQCWLPIFQSLWHHHHLIPIMGEKSLFQVAAVEFGRGSGAPFVPAHLISKMRGISAHMTQHFQDKILRLIWSHIFLSTLTFLHQDDHSFLGRSMMTRIAFPDWFCFWHCFCHVRSTTSHTTFLLKIVELMHKCLRIKKLHWRYY